MARRWAGALPVLLAIALTGCSGSHSPTSTPTPRPTPIAKLDVAAIRVARVGFCNQVPAPAVRRALGAKPEADMHWGNGDPLPRDSTTATTGDLTHELGCAWTGPSGSAARAWVFGRPTTAAFAQTLVTQAGKQPGCKAEPTNVFGKPALLQTCDLPGGVQRVRRAGLFGDSWVTCEVSGPTAPDLPTRTDAWCGAVVGAVQPTG